jgi:vancomycin aglycone glucosyltransferase
VRVLLSAYGGRGDVEPLVGLGIGTAHDGPTPTTGSLPAALGTALAPQTRARATAVAGTIRPDGATVAAALLTGAISRTGAARS